ncbi:o-succinylbenzoate--CoA ligase [Enterovibrio sp. ZSDZ42]|uniref:O-succinylbenzoate--CoA ligase n=1 Tax=Enterovibrio gelatinilyticus TaxID=2899819 RepID=A0ABT5QYB2_9GAMM|nr:o-succinylbenzoate--CoA ligase [Enterovibrio sp. ZSDZ42]MDD1793008.1 o-succinylbenzoate--CoA ligase [Enterovibrio sp. ZSDZ42]
MAPLKPISFSQWPWHHWMDVHPDETAIRCDRQNISWQQLCSDIDGVEFDPTLSNSSLVAILSENHYDTLVQMLAAWQQGFATLMLNPAFSASARCEIFERVGIEGFIDPSSDLLNDARNDSLNQPAFSTCFRQPSLPSTSRATGYDPQRCLTLTLTSGSSGSPKAVTHSADNHLASATGLFSLMPFESTDCWLLSLPLFHISGLAIVWRWLAKGATLKVADTSGDNLINALNGATHASLVPTQLTRLVEAAKPTSLHSVLLGGAVIPQALVDRAEQQGIGCWCGYGMTEMASTITAKRANGAFSVGATLPFRQLMLSDQDEVWVKGETLSAGYMVDRALVPLAQDWFQTKDKGSWASERNDLMIIGRLDNMFICGGENVQPETVERLLGRFEGISQLFIVPLADTRWGYIPVALVEGDTDTEAFLTWSKTRVPAYQCPKAVFPLPSHLLSGGIKISRQALSEWLHEQIHSLRNTSESN